MFDYGNGSHGALNVTSGTRNLALNTRHQFTTVNVSSGATLSTSSTTGSVLHISATESITINGTINVSNKVNHGNNSWSATLGGVTYTSPGVANGGRGDGTIYAEGGYQGNGFGGGGAGGYITEYTPGGAGGNATGTQGTGPAGPSVGATSGARGRNGSHSSGGSGAVGTQGGSSATGGKGGNAWGGNGGAGSVSGGGSAGGGGGAGGRAGRAGVHVVLNAPRVVINGTIVTSGTAGGNGGSGGAGAATGQAQGYDVRGWGGGGGGGGRAGNLYITSNSRSISGSLQASAGARGNGGGGKGSGAAGTAGSTGTSVYVTRYAPNSSAVYIDSSHSLTLTEDYNLSSDSSVIGTSSTTPTPVEGGPKVPVIAYGFGGGVGSANALAVQGYGVISKSILSDGTLEPRNTLTNTDSTSPKLGHQYMLLANSSGVNTSSSGIVLSQEHEIQVSESTSTTDSDSPWLIYSRLLDQPSPSIVYASSDTFWIAQDSVMEPDSLPIETYSKNIDIINWDRLGVGFGRYSETYSSRGELKDLVNYIFESEDEIFFFEDEQGYGILVPEQQRETLSHIKTYRLGGDLGVIINALFESEDSMFYFESEDEKELLGPEESKISHAFTKNYKQKGRF